MPTSVDNLRAVREPDEFDEWDKSWRKFDKVTPGAGVPTRDPGSELYPPQPSDDYYQGLGEPFSYSPRDDGQLPPDYRIPMSPWGPNADVRRDQASLRPSQAVMEAMLLRRRA